MVRPMKSSGLALAAFVLLASPVTARDDTMRSVAIGGAGRDACSAWIADRDAASASESAQRASQARIEWISGYFSAVNQFYESSGNLHGSIDDLNGMLGWIDSYCRKHPGDPLFVAATDLVFDLRNHPRN